MNATDEAPDGSGSRATRPPVELGTFGKLDLLFQLVAELDKRIDTVNARVDRLTERS